jgi:GNAT superfamily N-acetyltransferase
VVNAAFAVESTFIEGTRTDEPRMAEMTQKGEFLVAEDDLGWIIASVYMEVRGERGYFGMLAVAPARQGRGLGQRMIAAAEDVCRRRGCKHMDMVALSLRPELLPLYRWLGYAETGMVEEFRPMRPLKEGIKGQCIWMAKPL